MSSEMATGCVLMEVQNWWEAGWAEMSLCLWYVDVYYLTPTLGHAVLPWSEGADGQPSPSHIPGLSICPEAGEESMGGSAMWQTEGAAALGAEPCNYNTAFSTITQVCRQINSPSTKLGNDATFFVGWKREKKKLIWQELYSELFIIPPCQKKVKVRSMWEAAVWNMKRFDKILRFILFWICTGFKILCV